ncbi:MAG: bifunctional 5,10-methylenetetrahydrofolate dehydrogenase/5,10-methenyltetrahydrofolate cyclohydrolase [Caldisericia bacterium]|nr:bifunctional 5,10-methylenetetrahydrofolate dehydrogenase/5,10-methenyltetrahydrofolate cyclohydrolase [Caldisericia bacterium]
MSTTKILEARSISRSLRTQLKEEIQQCHPNKPCLASVLLEASSDALSYVENQEKAAKKIGLHYELISKVNANEEEVLQCIKELNEDSAIHGIIIQRPIPPRISFSMLANTLLPEKDVDCIHPYTAGRLFQSNPLFLPPTPASVMMILDVYKIPLEGKDVVMLGRSDVVGKPLSMMMLQKNATVQICHSHTDDLVFKCKAADILIVAVGKPHFVTPQMVHNNSIVIDVGINFWNGKLVGDADTESLISRVSAITPVPGGVGTLTTSILLQNTLKAYRFQAKHNDIV